MKPIKLQAAIVLSLAYLSYVLSSIAVAQSLLPYQNPALTDSQRVDDLLARMTLVEKVGQMCQYVGIEQIINSEKNLTLEEMQAGDAHGIYPGLHSSQIPTLIKRGEIGSFLHVKTPQEANRLQTYANQSRLGIPLLIGIDAIHGNGLVSGSTIYPTPLSMASSWNLDLVRKAAVETAREVRANGAQWAFAPNLDIARDPRWGRVGETFGEDPYLVGEMGAAMIAGLQQVDFTGSESVLANAKHFVAGGEPINGLNLSPMDISLRTLKQDYFPPFKRAVDAGVFSVMAAHNEVNGVPAHANRFLFTDVLRKAWGFKGFVVSDWMDIERLNTLHRVAENQTEAVFQSVDAGIDMHMHGPGFLKPLVALVKEGRISESRIDESLRPLLLAKFRLGLFENAQVDLSKTASTMFTPEHKATALALARQGIVLLKNDDAILPLPAGGRILITGPNANSHTITGDWVLEQPGENITTVLEGITEVANSLAEATRIDYFDVGDQVRSMDARRIQRAALRASKADVAIVVVGDNALRYDRENKTAGENVARSSLDLFGDQLALLKAIHATDTPLIVVLVNSRPVAEPWLVENAAAIIEAWEPGALGGQALAEIVFGLVNPSGKLPITIPYSVGHLQSIYNHKPSAYMRSYIDAPTQNLFEFGDGLSYTEFSYSEARLSHKTIATNQSVRVGVTVTNRGERAGDEVVQLYLRDQYSRVTRPVKELKGFKRIALEPGESQQVEFDITADMLAYYNLELQWQVEPGDFTIMVGGSSRDSDLQATTLTVID